LSRREDDFGYGAQALVVQGRPPADGVGQVFGFIGGGGETARTIARCDQAHGLAPWSFVENEGEKKGLSERAAAFRQRRHDGRGRAIAGSDEERMRRVADRSRARTSRQGEVAVRPEGSTPAT
jgi:hypothetical protein